jgi:Uma2 family endonuclease
MSTVDRPPGRRTLPPLAAGQRLDQPTFHARYEAMPPETRAELIGGVVYMPSPLRDDHGWTSHVVSGWLFHYERFTPGVRGSDNATTKLGQAGESQPDCLLRIPEGAGGRCRVVVGFLVGAPELVVEVARSSRWFDLGPKRLDYERAGVVEYIFVGLDPDEVRWFAARGDHFEELPPGPDGLFRSEVFPGLWLDPAALFASDLNALIAALDRGLATPEHAAFVDRLAGR